MNPEINKPNLDDILNQALELLASGQKTEADVLAMFPQVKEDIAELWQAAKIVHTEKNKLQPRRELLDKILTQLEDSSVTEPSKNRYIYREKPQGLKGRFSLKLFTHQKLKFMSKQIYYLAGAITLIIAILVGFYVFYNSSKPNKVAQINEAQELAYVSENLSKDVTDLKQLAEDKDLATLDQDLAAVAEEKSGEDSQNQEEFSNQEASTQTSAKQTTTESQKNQTNAVDVSSLENLEEELSSELDGFADDLTDLEETANDNSLDNLDNSLANF